MGFGTPPAPPAITNELTDKEVDGVIDHADGSVTDEKLASGVGLEDEQICKLPTAVEDQVLMRGETEWEAGDIPPALNPWDDYFYWLCLYESMDGWGDGTRARFDTLVIWEHELREPDKVLQRILEFDGSITGREI